MTLLSLISWLVLGAAAEVSAPSSLQIMDRNGAVLRTVLSEDETFRRPVPLEEVSPWAVLATLAAEDRRFFSHPGVDFQAVLRALWQDARAGRAVSGASTLTQQLARAVEARPRTLRGKLSEAWRALSMERRLGKRDILEEYFNVVSYGNRAQGIEAAARTYFGLPARDLSLGQAALLSGIPKSPSNYDPIRHLAEAKRHQRAILKSLRGLGWIDDANYRLALGEKIRIVKQDRRLLAPHFTEFVRLNGGQGLVKTTVDAALQEAFEGLLRSHLAQLKPNNVTNGAVIALDNSTGEVLAWVGSADFWDEKNQGQVDAVTARRQPGSALKPFAYGLALSEGMKTSDLLNDAPLYGPDGFKPKNYDESFHGPVRVREALACSFNIPAVLVAERLGAGKLLAALRRFGLVSLDQSAEHYGLGLVLGNGEITLLELANAYAALARGGVWLPTRTTFGGKTAGKRVLDRGSSYLVTHILSDNAARAEAFGLNSPLNLPFPFAAKTGTTKDYKDNWAMGYTPGWTVGVWVGNFDGKPMQRVSGISGAAPILHDAAVEMERRYGSRPFPRPAGIREVEICPLSGGLPGAWCPATMKEVYAAGNMPTKVCALHHKPEARAAVSGGAVEIEFPKSGDVFKIDPATPRGAQAILLRATRQEEGLVWEVDGQRLASGWWTLTAGRHKATLIFEKKGKHQRSPSVSFIVLP